MKRGCYTKNPNSLRQQIEDLLLEHGGMTVSDLCEELPQYTKGGISKTICDLHDAQIIFVEDYEMSQPGQKRHPRPMWNHAKNSKRQPPQDKGRPLPVTNAIRMKRRRAERAGRPVQIQCLFKFSRPRGEAESSEET